MFFSETRCIFGARRNSRQAEHRPNYPSELKLHQPRSISAIV